MPGGGGEEGGELGTSSTREQSSQHGALSWLRCCSQRIQPKTQAVQAGQRHWLFQSLVQEKVEWWICPKRDKDLWTIQPTWSMEPVYLHWLEKAHQAAKKKSEELRKIYRVRTSWTIQPTWIFVLVEILLSTNTPKNARRWASGISFREGRVVAHTRKIPGMQRWEGGYLTWYLMVDSQWPTEGLLASIFVKVWSTHSILNCLLHFTRFPPLLLWDERSHFWNFSLF